MKILSTRVTLTKSIYGNDYLTLYSNMDHKGNLGGI